MSGKEGEEQVPRRFDAVLLDLDGVITRTAEVHARAWKRMFDEYLERRARGRETFTQFDLHRDYPRYVDGKPRYDGVRMFLHSRGIELPDGDPTDGPDRETVCGLGNRKNDIFRKILETDGVRALEESVEQIRRWRDRGIMTAVVSSSRNCKAVLEAAGLTELFDIEVDGVETARLGLNGKPAPDAFLLAARRLGIHPRRAVVVEDAAAGVQAGRAGNFGLVVGLAEPGRADLLRASGADIVVGSLGELHIEGDSRAPGA